MFLCVALGVLTLAVCAFCEEGNNKDCHLPPAIQSIQRACKQVNEEILSAEAEENQMEVCRLFPLLMKCSVTALPRCYDYIENQYRMYGHSPFSCQLMPEDIKELQEIVHKGTQVKEVPVTTTTTAAPAVVAEQSSTTFLNILPSSTFRSSQKVTEGQTNVHPGNKERREGGDMHDDGRAVISNIPTMALLLVMTLLMRWLTSGCLST